MEKRLVAALCVAAFAVLFLAGCGKAVAPTFSPDGGKYQADQSVTIASETAEATITYTTDGTDPASSATAVSVVSPVGPITVTISPSTTIRAIAVATNYDPSDESTATYEYGQVYQVGDTGPAGGLGFYDKGSYSDQWRYLEAAASDESADIPWDAGTRLTTSATGSAVGDGSANTSTIIAAQGSGSYAATVCTALAQGGMTDWYLPSKDELSAIYSNLAAKGLGGLTGTDYWSSTEDTKYKAFEMCLLDGIMYSSGKDFECRVRAVRRF